MTSLYSEQNLSDLRKQIRCRLFLLLAVLIVAIAAVAGTLILDNHKENRPELATTLIVILSGCLLIFLYDMLVHPLRAYEKHMDLALHGRSHEASVIFERLDEDVSLVEGVNFRDLIFLGEADKHGDRERMFYWDQELPLPNLQKGQEVTLRYYDRFITAWE